MCGIAAAIGFPNAADLVKQLIQAILHRGEITDPVAAPLPGIALGTRRLPIVDRSGGVQPHCSADGRILVAFNGEIYNHADLRQELEALGVTFTTNSDTETLANGLATWGPQIMRRLDGMYAFVAVDLSTGEFLAARDPFGVKPLYIVQRPEGPIFCSEIKPLLHLIDDAEVHLLPPGTCFTSKGLFLSPAPEVSVPSADARNLDSLLRAAVHSRVPPDLPFALLLSGGLDSTLVAHYAREMRPGLSAFFLGSEQATDYCYAAEAADRMRLNLETVDLEAGSMGDPTRLKAVVATAEAFDPNVVREAFCNVQIFRRIHERGFRVALSGEGADELFGGYKPIEVAFQMGEDVGLSVREQCIGLMGRTNLQRLDRSGMHFQVEAREPFLNRSVAAYARKLTGQQLMGECDGRLAGKRPLKDVYRLYPDLPESVVNRVKMPLHVGCGLDVSQKDSPLADFAEQAIGDAEFAEGQAHYADFSLSTKEELLYLTMLNDVMDVRRVPHLKSRTNLYLPRTNRSGWANKMLQDYIVA